MAIGKLLKQNKVVKLLIKNKDKNTEENGVFPTINTIYDRFPDIIEERYEEIQKIQKILKEEKEKSPKLEVKKKRIQYSWGKPLKMKSDESQKPKKNSFLQKEVEEDKQ